jgi:hypothetical protein
MSVVDREIGRSSRRLAINGTNSTPPLIIEVFDIFFTGENFGFGLEDISAG